MGTKQESILRTLQEAVARGVLQPTGGQKLRFRALRSSKPRTLLDPVTAYYYCRSRRVLHEHQWKEAGRRSSIPSDLALQLVWAADKVAFPSLRKQLEHISNVR